MLESIFILLVIAGFTVMILSVLWKSYVLSTLTLIIFLLCALNVHNIEIPYQEITSGDSIVTGVQEVQSMAPLSWLFIGLMLLMFLYTWALIFEEFIKPHMEKKRML